MNYEKIYKELIHKTTVRNIKKQGWENHHIIPRCLGGTSERNNIVVLTPREHYVAHRLLFKIYPSNAKIIYAFWMMSHKNVNGTVTREYRVSSRTYEIARLAFCNVHTGRIHTQDALTKMRGRKCTELQNSANSLLQKKLIQEDEVLGIKRSERLKSWLPFWTDGHTEIRSAISPGSNWGRGRITKGKKWWNNGKDCKMQITTPGPGWTIGRLYRRKK